MVAARRRRRVTIAQQCWLARRSGTTRDVGPETIAQTMPGSRNRCAPNDRVSASGIPSLLRQRRARPSRARLAVGARSLGALYTRAAVAWARHWMLSDNVAPALNNSTTIAALYDSLPFPTATAAKLEGPASASLANAAAALAADPTPGGKYIVWPTDGQPDYCDDANALCARDSVIFHLQKARAAGIATCRAD
jgi:hypothetical protein